jgi:hypothetical protein
MENIVIVATRVMARGLLAEMRMRRSVWRMKTSGKQGLADLLSVDEDLSKKQRM